MNSPTSQTALMGLVATVISLVAAWFYPWPETATRSDLVGKPLFESFEAKDVRTITVTEYDADRNGLKQIVLRRVGDLWVIPARQNFIANNAEQISSAINTVNTNVLEQRSNDLQDHVEYGVIDPLEFESTPARNSLGKKIVLQDRNNRELASLIVGGTPRDDANVNRTRRFVRVTGKPGVYVVDLSAQALTTEFSKWVSSNLFELNDLNEIGKMVIKNYRTEKEQLSTSEPRQIWRYQLELDAANQKQSLQVPDSKGDLSNAEVPADLPSVIANMGRFLSNIAFSNVRKKHKSVAELLKNPQAESGNSLTRLNESGFAVTGRIGDRNFGLKLQSSAGELVLQTRDGLSVSLLVGDLVEAQAGDSSDLSRLVMLYASFDPAYYTLPEKPDSDDEGKQKAYLRQVAERDAKIKSANERVQLLNNYYADWYFVVTEQILNALIPDLRLEANVDSSSKTSGNGESPTSELNSSGETVSEPTQPTTAEETAERSNDKDGE